jgi:hypothetical protein
MEEQSSAAIACPQCGSALLFREGDRNLSCPSCKVPLAISGEAGTGRFYLDEKLDLPQARSAARKFLVTRGIDEKIVARLRFEGGELCYLPFWSLRGHAFGWQLAERETTVKEEYVDENGMTRVRERRGPVERTFENLATVVDYSTPACDLSPYGLKGIAVVSSVLPLRGMAYERLAQRGTVFDPDKGADQVRKEALAQAGERVRPSGTLRRINRMKVCGERLALISYPVWRLSFSAGQRLYPVVVDGVNGSVLKARFPGSIRINLFVPMLAVALVMFALSVHPGLGLLTLVGGIVYLLSQGGFSLESLVSRFLRLVQRGREVEHG